MTTETVIYIILSAIIALSLALFQYAYKSKKIKLHGLFISLRFIAIFSVLLLLFNPTFEAVTYYDEKPNLIIAIDNSESVKYLKQDEKAKLLYNNLISNAALKERFNIETFSFGNSFKTVDSLTFNEQQTDFSQVFKNHNELYKQSIAPLILITDGNQTLGNDYQYQAIKLKQPIIPVILGDTLTFSDLRLQQVNSNRFAYLKNRFPVEIIAGYSGDAAVKTQLHIISGNAIVFSKDIAFSATKTSEIINTTLIANTAGVQSYRVELVPLTTEKNKVNNTKNFAVEVIDQKINVALVSDQLHPDLGAIKKAIERNEQRSVTILKPKDYLVKINDFQLVILYQPNTNFKAVLLEISKLKLNTFTITGKTTDWNTINNGQAFYKQEITNQTENYQPQINTNYSTFIIDNITFNNYPPLQSEFGSTNFKVPHETILFKTINENATETPLLTTFETEGQKHALLNGEGIWRWRAQSFLETESFTDFDNFIAKLMQYLGTNKKRNRLDADYKSFYIGTDNISISAQFFNKNYEFDAKANLEITLNNKTDGTSKSFPLLLKNVSYIIDLDGISPGDYKFTIKSTDEPISVSGQFKVLEYNSEQQFLNADVTKLQNLATNSKGKAFFIDKKDQIISSILNDNRFVTIQKSKRSVITLIDYQYLLALISLVLSLEWLIRKYNGLI
jgi:energy-coupling factor transporter transmembrane protein EcfT